MADDQLDQGARPLLAAEGRQDASSRNLGQSRIKKAIKKVWDIFYTDMPRPVAPAPAAPVYAPAAPVHAPAVPMTPPSGIDSSDGAGQHATDLWVDICAHLSSDGVQCIYRHHKPTIFRRSQFLRGRDAFYSTDVPRNHI